MIIIVRSAPSKILRSAAGIGCLQEYPCTDASAVVYSIAETALLNGLKPYIYLTYVLDELRKMGPFPKPDDLNRLLHGQMNYRKDFELKRRNKMCRPMGGIY